MPIWRTCSACAGGERKFAQSRCEAIKTCAGIVQSRCRGLNAQFSPSMTHFWTGSENVPAQFLCNAPTKLAHINFLVVLFSWIMCAIHARKGILALQDVWKDNITKNGAKIADLKTRRRSKLLRNSISDGNIHAPSPQNRPSTSGVQNWGWWVLYLSLRFQQSAHHPPKYHLEGRSFVGMVRGSQSLSIANDALPRGKPPSSIRRRKTVATARRS